MLKKIIRYAIVQNQRFLKYLWDIIINGLLSSYVIPVSLRRLIFKILGINCKGTIHGHCYIGSRQLKVGKHSYINRECLLDIGANSSISIGCNCAIGYKVKMFTTNHDMHDPNCRAGYAQNKSIIIDDGTWVGGGTIILPSVHIGKGCVIAAGAVVSKDCDENGLYAGIPARRIRDL